MGTLPCDLLLEEREWSACLGNTSIVNMMKLALTLVSLVAAVTAQDEVKETPLWFLKDLDGRFSERSGQCPGLLAANQDVASFGPILIPEDKDAKICIRFPARDGRDETWRHDLGSKGACANGCCEFKPPLKNPPPPAPQPTWFEGSNCADTSAAFEGPTLFMERIWTKRASASNWRTEVMSLEKDSLTTVELVAAFFMARPPKKIFHCYEPNNVQD